MSSDWIRKLQFAEAKLACSLLFATLATLDVTSLGKLCIAYVVRDTVDVYASLEKPHCIVC